MSKITHVYHFLMNKMYETEFINRRSINQQMIRPIVDYQPMNILKVMSPIVLTKKIVM